MQTHRGFTAVELLVVLAIVGTTTAIATRVFIDFDRMRAVRTDPGTTKWELR